MVQESPLAYLRLPETSQPLHFRFYGSIFSLRVPFFSLKSSIIRITSSDVAFDGNGPPQVDISLSYTEYRIVLGFTSIYVGVGGQEVYSNGPWSGWFTPEEEIGKDRTKDDIKDKLDQLGYSAADQDRIYNHLLRMSRELSCGLSFTPDTVDAWADAPALQCNIDVSECVGNCCEELKTSDFGFDGPSCGDGSVPCVRPNELSATWSRTDTITL